MSGFGNILFFNIILFPVLRSILGNRTASVNAKLTKAVGVFSLFVAVSIGKEVMDWEDNYFQVLGVPRTATTREIKKAYLIMSKVVHPDVNKAPDAEDQFMRLGKIKEAFASETNRRVYDRFGEHFYSSPHHDQWLENPMSMAFYHISYYGSALLLIFIITHGQSRAQARTWCCLLLGAMGFYELMAKYDDEDWDFLTSVFPSWTLYQKIEIYHSVLIYCFHLLSSYAELTYFDIHIWQLAQFQELRNEIGVAVTMIEEVEARLPKKKGADDDAVPDGKSLQRRMKVQKFKENKAAQMNQSAPQQKQGTNWLSLFFTAFFIYNWWTGGS